MKVRDYIIICLGVLLIMTSCKSEYNSYVERELATEIQNDSIFLGLKLGHTRKEFFAICWDLNKQELLGSGTGNQTARYYIEPDSTEDQTKRIEMLFYGMFDHDEVMRGMDVEYSYTSWAPWNRRLHSDSLVVELKQRFMDDYGGNEFINIEMDNLKFDASVKIDGNRQILMYPKNNRFVVVRMEDLNHKMKNI